MTVIKRYLFRNPKVTSYQLFLWSCGQKDTQETRAAWKEVQRMYHQCKDFYPSDRRTLKQILIDNFKREQERTKCT